MTGTRSAQKKHKKPLSENDRTPSKNSPCLQNGNITPTKSHTPTKKFDSSSKSETSKKVTPLKNTSTLNESPKTLSRNLRPRKYLFESDSTEKKTGTPEKCNRKMQSDIHNSGRSCTKRKLNLTSTEDEESTPKKRRTCYTPSELKTPTRSVLTPSIRSNLGTPVTEMDEARLKLHVCAVSDVLDQEIIPESLMCREEEFKQIYDFLKKKMIRECSGYMYISGVPGSGKTATVHRVIKKLQNECRQKNNNLKDFKYIEINGIYLSEPGKAYCKILYQYSGEIASGKQARYLLSNKFRRTSKDSPVILFVDEMDCLYNKARDVIFNILNWHLEPQSQLIVLTIANDDSLISVIKDYFGGKIEMDYRLFSAYSNQNLLKIVTNRLQGSNVFEPNAIEFLIKKRVTKNGDARAVLDICRKFIDLINEEDENVSVITLKHIKQACEKIAVDPVVSVIDHCSTSEKILLKAMQSESSVIGAEYSLDERIYLRVREICTLEGEVCPTIHQACLICYTLSNAGLLKSDSDEIGIHSKIRLNIDPNLISYALDYGKRLR